LACVETTRNASSKLVKDLTAFEIRALAQGCDQPTNLALRYFGSLPSTMFTLLQVMTGDSWAEAIARPVMKNQPYHWVLFVAYISVAAFVLMNLVTAIIVDNALSASRADEEEILRQKKLEDAKNLKYLYELFLELDEDGSGELTLDEVKNAFTNQMVVDRFNLLNLDEERVLELFNVLNCDEGDGEGTITMEVFSDGMTQIKKPLSSWNLLKVSTNVIRLQMKWQKFMEIAREKLGIAGEDEGCESPMAPKSPSSPLSPQEVPNAPVQRLLINVDALKSEVQDVSELLEKVKTSVKSGKLKQEQECEELRLMLLAGLGHPLSFDKKPGLLKDRS